MGSNVLCRVRPLTHNIVITYTLGYKERHKDLVEILQGSWRVPYCTYFFLHEGLALENIMPAPMSVNFLEVCASFFWVLRHPMTYWVLWNFFS
jgi:hypothetical protein